MTGAKAAYLLMMDGVLDEEVIKLLSCTFCTYSHTFADYTASCSDCGCGNYPEYVTLFDDSRYYDDHISL